MKIIGLVRARNEARWIARCVKSMREVCCHVVVMDDHSADATWSLAEMAGADVIASPFDRNDFHEARDKQWLYEQVLTLKPDWCLMLDGDEMLAHQAIESLKAGGLTHATYDAYSLRIRYLWDREDQVRVDRWYSTFTRASLWRVLPGFKFESAYPNGLHCGNTPAGLKVGTWGADILHFGYMHREDRIRKFEYYNRIDPGNIFEDGYRHMVIGDLPEFPPETVTKWAGPLKLEPLR